jgi:YhcH/YjgK/YiaL family protein
MVFDNLKNIEKYEYNKNLITAMEFIKTLHPDSEEGKYEIDGDRMFAIVMSYNSKPRTEAVLESHKRYVDIQSTIFGSEGMERFHIDELKLDVEYNSEKDVMFYKNPQQTKVRFNVEPGEFAIFYPTDAHMTQLMNFQEPSLIKKVVVKISVDLL